MMLFSSSKKLLIISVINIFFFNKGISQITEGQAKDLLFEHISEVSEYEGIFEIKTAEIRSTVCHMEKIVEINDRIAIININNHLKVFSITNKEEIGEINLRYDNGWYGVLNSTGFSKYPNLRLTSLLWQAELSYGDINYFAHSQVKNAISQIKNYCNYPDWCLNPQQEWVCHTTVTYSLDKIFPNEFEPPPNKASSGSGIIVSKQGHIITNKHVVQKQNYVFKNHPERWVIEESLGFPDSYSDIATSITASIGGVNYNLAPVICYDQSSGNLLVIPEDLIILKILNPPSTIKFTVLDNSANNLGDEVYTLGFPLSSTLGSRMIYSNGYFSSESIEFDIYNMSINPGNSGGGIFDKKTGNLVGITTARIDDERVGIKTEGICFGTRLNSLSEIVKSSNTKFLNLSKYSDNTGKWKWVNSELGLAYTKSAFSILVRDNTFKPSITVENNRAATVQIIAQ